MMDHGKNILIGVFVLAAIVLVVWMVLFLHPQVGDEDQILHVYFTNVEKIKEGTRVTLAGKPIGSVQEVKELPDARELPPAPDGALYMFDVEIGIDSDVKVYNTDRIRIAMTGLFGERNIEIVPVRPPPGVQAYVLKPGSTIYAKASDQMGDAFSQLSGLSDTLGDALTKFSELLDQNADNIHDAVLAFKNAMTEMGITFSDVNETELVNALKSTFETATDLLANLYIHMEELEQDGFWSNVTSMMANLEESSESLNTVLANVRDGKGTIGQLLSNEETYLELMSLLGKADTVMNDINHYGILFNTNRDWKRHRAQRLNTLSEVSTPQGFQSYFNCELDQISTSLARVSMLLERVRCSCSDQQLLDNPCFAEAFACLMKKVKRLEKRLDLYNEQLVEEHRSPCAQPCDVPEEQQEKRVAYLSAPQQAKRQTIWKPSRTRTSRKAPSSSPPLSSKPGSTSAASSSSVNTPPLALLESPSTSP